MNASVINRFAKNVTTMARPGRSSWARRGYRLALAVPLAAVTATGVVGCTPGKAPAGAAQAIPTTSPSVSATFSPTATPAPSTPAPARQTAAVPVAEKTSTKPSKAPGTVPGKVSSDGALDIAIHFAGVSGDQYLWQGRTEPVDLTVTWTNPTDHEYNGVSPVVATQPYPGARCQVPNGAASGTLERKDGDHWTMLPSLSQGTGMDYASTGDAAAFDLAPGASRTVRYRIQLATENGDGLLPLEADAFSRIGDGNYRKLASTVKNLELHGVTAPVAGLAGFITSSLTNGGQPVEFGTSVTNVTHSPYAAARPEVSLVGSYLKGSTELRPQDVTVEVFTGGAWRRLAVDHGCEGLAIDTAALSRALPAGEVMTDRLRVSLAATAPKGLDALSLRIGAVGDSRYSVAQHYWIAVVHQG